MFTHDYCYAIFSSLYATIFINVHPMPKNCFHALSDTCLPLQKQFGHREDIDGEAMCLIRLEFSALGNRFIEAGLGLNITQYFEVES